MWGAARLGLREPDLWSGHEKRYYHVVMLEISLPPETEETLRKRAEANGEDVALFAARLLQDALNAPSVDELLAPFRSQVEESGMTDDELDELGNALRQDVRDGRRARQAKTG